MNDLRPKSCWYHVTPDRFLAGLLAVEGLLLLSERFGWFPFNERKGYTVLVAVVCAAQPAASRPSAPGN